MDRKTFQDKFVNFVQELQNYCMDRENNWKIKGFIDADRTIFTISTDTKIISKILEIHIFPKIANFADKCGFEMILPSSQNYYPDMTFVYKEDKSIKYAIDIKTTFTRPNTNFYCSFTLGSHGSYFKDRESKKNIEFPYKDYKGHFVLGIVYQKADNIDEKKTFNLDELDDILSVINNLKFFFIEKWKIASDKQGSGNTANIGGILKEENDMFTGNGIFKNDQEFNDYWINYGIRYIKDDGNSIMINDLKTFREWKKKG